MPKLIPANLACISIILLDSSDTKIIAGVSSFFRLSTEYFSTLSPITFLNKSVICSLDSLSSFESLSFNTSDKSESILLNLVPISLYSINEIKLLSIVLSSTTAFNP